MWMWSPLCFLELAVLRRSGLVSTCREGSTVFFSLAGMRVAELLAVDQAIPTSSLSEQLQLLEDSPTQPIEGSGDPATMPGAAA